MNKKDYIIEDYEIMIKSSDARKFIFPPNEESFGLKTIAGELGKLMRTKTYEEQKAYYKLSEDNFFYIDNFEQYIRLKKYLGFKGSLVFDVGKTKHVEWHRNCSMYYNKLRGNRFHLIHGRKLIHGYKKDFDEWYKLKKAPEEFYYINLHLNALTNLHLNRCGTYHLLEYTEFDITKCTTRLNGTVYKMLWKRLINEKLKKADKTNFVKFMKECKVDIEFARRHTKSFRLYIIDKIVKAKRMSILDCHIVKALIDGLGYNYFKLANETRKYFTHKTIDMFPLQTENQKAVNKQREINRELFKDSTTEYDDPEAFTDIWDDFWNELE